MTAGKGADDQKGLGKAWVGVTSLDRDLQGLTVGRIAVDAVSSVPSPS